MVEKLGVSLNTIDEFVRLLERGDYVGALRLLERDMLALSAVRRVLGDGFLVRVGVLAVLSGAKADEVKKLLEKLGVRNTRVVDIAASVARGDIGAAARLAEEAGEKALAELLRSIEGLADPESVAKLVARVRAKYPELAAKLALIYIARYLRKRGYNAKLAEVARAAGAANVARMLSVYNRAVLEALAEAIENAKLGMIVDRSLAEVVKLGDRVKRLAKEAEKIAKELDETSDVWRAASLLARLVNIYEELKRDVEKLEKLGARTSIDLEKMRKAIKRAALGIALVAGIKLIQGDESVKTVIDGLVKTLRRVDPELAKQLSAIENLGPVTLSEALCVLKHALHYTPAVAAGAGARRGRAEVM